MSAEAVTGLLVLEPKPLRPFRSKDEYVYAMKEDLAEWFATLYTGLVINADNFLTELETGVLLCKHANQLRQFVDEQKTRGVYETLNSNFVRDIQIPGYTVQYRTDVKSGTFLARDNISNFITWTARLGIPEVLRFETDDLVLCKNERSVVLCLLEVARIGAKFGMLAPTIVRMEEEIESEIETGKPPAQIITCDVKSLDELVQELVGRCTCPRQFAIIKVGEGKYKIGDNQTLVFVRILRKHVMIRVGGGWDTLEHYLDRHDPCRCGYQGGGRPGVRSAVQTRRSSTPSVPQPKTPQPSRKFSATSTPLSSRAGHSDATAARPPSPRMRSLSPSPKNSTVSTDIFQTNNVKMNTPRLNKKQSIAYAAPYKANTRNADHMFNEDILDAAPISNGALSEKNMFAQEAGLLSTSLGLRHSLDGDDLKGHSSSSSATHLSKNNTPNIEMATETSNFAIDKISTMSLGEFKNLLNSTLTVPNNVGQRCESPFSQSSGDSYKANIDQKGECRIPKAETHYSRVSSRLSSKHNLDSSSGYSTSSPSSDKTTKSTTYSAKSATLDSVQTSKRTDYKSQYSDVPFKKSFTPDNSKTSTRVNKRLDQNDDVFNRKETETLTQTSASTLTNKTSNTSANKIARQKDLYSVNDISTEPTLNIKPQNVSYVSVSYDEVKNDSVDNEIDDINTHRHILEKKEADSPLDISNRPKTPSGRTTPSCIPRPVTPKLPKKSSLSTPVEIRNRTGLPPTPRKTSVAHANEIARSADKIKEQTYRDIFRKRSTTPSIECSPHSSASLRRAVTPGPYLRSSFSLDLTSDQTSFIETHVLTKEHIQTEKKETTAEPVIVVSVDRTANKHTLSLTNQRVESTPDKPVVKSKVLARARTPHNDKAKIRMAEISREKRPQSVEPSQLFLKTNKPEEKSYDRTQEWVQTTARQTKVKQPKAFNVRRAMTPNSLLLTDSINAEPRSLDEIKAALTLPIHTLKEINTEQLEAPPEDPEMYAKMEQLFHELRQQELKNSVNETPGDGVVTNSSCPRSESSKSDRSNQNSKRSAEKEPVSTSRSQSRKSSLCQMKNVSTKMSNSGSDSLRKRSSVSGSSTSEKANTRSPSPSPHINANQRPPSPINTASRKSNPVSEKVSLNQQRTDSSVRKAFPVKQITSRPASPSSYLQSSRASSQCRDGSMRPESTPPYKSNPESPTNGSDTHPRTQIASRPASPFGHRQSSRASSQSRDGSMRPESTSSYNSNPESPASGSETHPRTQIGSRPASPFGHRQSSRASNHSSAGSARSESTPPYNCNREEPVSGSVVNDSNTIVKKIKEIIKVQPRKDKVDGQKKTKIPAPRSLSQLGKSKSVCNLLEFSTGLHAIDNNVCSGTLVDDKSTGSFSDTISRKLATPLTTGRSSLIRKESMEKNRTTAGLFVRTLSTERKDSIGNLSGEECYV
ncbi:GAS2-like protein 2A [Dreissena polymorpha]|uniref:GAS2-like protein 1 n=1 Tax=Dreissena polymorpha TaxID=45954 RepID=A0A9D4N842_DREPO|nr:GAS2-like protein 2A [Dreissena polymorpha]KAH3890765.1 hypothetical protein DPMN_014853 [Dreissena polymorpha]